LNKFYYELIIKPESYYELYLDLINSLINEAIEELNEMIIIRSEDTLISVEFGIIEFTKELSKVFNTQIICSIKLNKKENINWIQAYKDSVEAVEVAEFYIHPSWKKPKKTKKNILINPALTFGSGHHETTSMCLESINKYIKASDDVLDVGCGSGILGIAAAKLYANVDICDTDISAVNDAVKNFKLNSVYCKNYWEGSVNKTNKLYDVVIANIVADVLIMIYKDLKKITKNNGIIILSGIMDKYKQKILNKFNNLELIDIIEKNEWITLVVKNKEDDEEQ
jgi:ribosomal protein L11 methyltransferase